MSDLAAVQLRPTALTVRPDNIPVSLRALPQWLLWKFSLRGGKWTKVPYQTCGKPASSTDPATWTKFDTVMESYRSSGFDGIGIALDGKVDADGLTLAAVDIDKAVGDPDRQARAEQIIASMGSYTELSPSGKGYRIFLRARPLSSGVNSNGVELYTSGRYLTVTGHMLDGRHA